MPKATAFPELRRLKVMTREAKAEQVLVRAYDDLTLKDRLIRRFGASHVKAAR